MTPAITKEGIMQELYAIVSEKIKQDTIIYVYGRLEPVTARKFYIDMHCQIERDLEAGFNNPSRPNLVEYFSNFHSNAEAAHALVADYEKECAELIV